MMVHAQFYPFLGMTGAVAAQGDMREYQKIVGSKIRK